MKADILLGLQWGDEGKGKIVDVLAPDYDIVARFQGGPNAGHTLEFDGRKHVLRSIPSGVFAKGSVTNVIGNGVVLDPVLFRKEAAELEADGVDLKAILKISKKAHLIMPTHRLLDAAGEAAMGSAKIGTTGKGIGPTYADKISRHGLRVGDILDANFDGIYTAAKESHLRTLRNLGANVDMAAFGSAEEEWLDALDYLRTFDLADTEHYVNKSLDEDHSILCEGAQGTMLDIDFGSYPFVTSSNTVAAGACTGLGLAPRRIGRVYGIFKAYCTRVGSGPFPTELFDATGEEICSIGHEFGAVTGRKRRCGWLDLVALRYAVMINGATHLIMMKSDVLDSFESIKVCNAYRLPDGTITRDFPFCVGRNAAGEADVEPIYETFPGWLTVMSSARKKKHLPQAFLDYVAYIEEQVGVPVAIISVGPDREQTIMLNE
ncbi:MAG: adenylosuccinate synthase [Muribaculaceae bacterium]|nr:adenylosuccinate synthase [Muribaculaceae bacterium]